MEEKRSLIEADGLPTVSPEAPPPTQPQPEKRRNPFIKFLVIFLAVRFGLLPLLDSIPPVGPWKSHHHKHGDHENSCGQAKPMYPSGIDPTDVVKDGKTQIVNWMSGAVKVPTESFDGMGEVGEDDRWEIFYKFADYLENAYPLVHKHLTRTRVNTHNLVFEWQGSDESLKPLFLTAHQDVVPVLPATRKLWTHDPYGGEYDTETDRIWGRGSGDDKSGVIGIMSSLELLLQHGQFKPTRSIVIGFGIDEEAGGRKGAGHINEWLMDKYGKDSMALLVDEGGGVGELWGPPFALPGVAEKGYLDVEMRVETLGGHSSVPPTHTGIGYISLFLAELEKHPHTPHIRGDSPLINQLQCGAEYSPDMPKKLKKAVEKNAKAGKKGDKKTLEEIADMIANDNTAFVKYYGLGKAMISTTQAIDIINGGLKVNALPEVVTAVINHRIAIDSSPGELKERIQRILKPIAKEYNLAMEAFGEDLVEMDASKAGKVVLAEAWNSGLEAAPVTPFTTESPAWRIFSGTCKSVYSSRPDVLRDDEKGQGEKDQELLIAPSYNTGNTDTKMYWNLTRDIFRFSYFFPNGGGPVHTVDEFIVADHFVEMVRWFTTLILNVDENREI